MGTDIGEMGTRVKVTTGKRPCSQCLRHQRQKNPPAPWETVEATWEKQVRASPDVGLRAEATKSVTLSPLA